MPTISDVHFQIIRIAVGYSLLGVFVITALVCLLSFIQIPSRRSGVQPRPLVIIDPPWFRKSLYSSLIIQIVATAALFWKSLLAVDTTETARQVQTAIEKQGVKVVTDDIRGVGILRYWRRSNDFLPHMREAMAKASSEIWISGASFYLSVPDNEDLLIDRAKHGVKIHYLILDPYGTNLDAIARTFGQSSDELREECLTTVRALRRIREKLLPPERERLEVRLFNESPRARFYFFDPDDSKSNTFFVPHVNSINSPAAPGFLLSNIPFGLARIYFASIKDFWASAQPLSDWEMQHKQTPG
jgi:Domain of unknown function (DUF5919)